MERICRLALRCAWRNRTFGFARNHHIPGTEVYSSIFKTSAWDHDLPFHQNAPSSVWTKANEVGALKQQRSCTPSMLPSWMDRLVLLYVQSSTLILSRILVVKILNLNFFLSFSFFYTGNHPHWFFLYYSCTWISNILSQSENVMVVLGSSLALLT